LSSNGPSRASGRRVIRSSKTLGCVNFKSVSNVESIKYCLCPLLVMPKNHYEACDIPSRLSNMNTAFSPSKAVMACTFLNRYPLLVACRYHARSYPLRRHTPLRRPSHLLELSLSQVTSLDWAVFATFPHAWNLEKWLELLVLACRNGYPLCIFVT